MFCDLKLTRVRTDVLSSVNGNIHSQQPNGDVHIKPAPSKWNSQCPTIKTSWTIDSYPLRNPNTIKRNQWKEHTLDLHAISKVQKKPLERFVEPLSFVEPLRNLAKFTTLKFNKHLLHINIWRAAQSPCSKICKKYPLTYYGGTVGNPFQTPKQRSRMDYPNGLRWPYKTFRVQPIFNIITKYINIYY